VGTLLQTPNPPKIPSDSNSDSAAQSRTSLDEGSARRRDLYLITHNIHKRQTAIPQAGFEPAISASERPQTYASDRADTGIGA
jgi:hypothetical protein